MSPEAKQWLVQFAADALSGYKGEKPVPAVLRELGEAGLIVPVRGGAELADDCVEVVCSAIEKGLDE